MITATSSGDLTVDTSDNWVASMQNYSGSTSSDPRLAHVFQNSYGSTRTSSVLFVNGDDNPTWTFNITVDPGQTVAILHFASGQPSKAEAEAVIKQIRLKI